MNLPWWGYVLLAGLSWGVYVPIIFYGGSELGGKPNSRLMAILCVGIAYFVLAVLFPLVLFLTGQQEWPTLKSSGLVFAGLAGVAGALGAICVVFASSAALSQGRAEVAAEKASLTARLASATPTERANLEQEQAQLAAEEPARVARYRMLIAPLIFGLAPVINTLLSSVWHPKPGNPLHFGFTTPDWRLLVGILLVGVGVAMVLYSKEASEVKASPGVKPPAPTPSGPTVGVIPETVTTVR